MNKEHMIELRDLVAELPPKSLNMNYWFMLGDNFREIFPEHTDGDGFRRNPSISDMRAKGFECGSVGCIGGWTDQIVRQKGLKGMTAQEYLGLTSNERSLLFHQFPKTPRVPYENNEFSMELAKSRDWKEWILKRLDDAIESGMIVDLSVNYSGDSTEDQPVEF